MVTVIFTVLTTTAAFHLVVKHINSAHNIISVRVFNSTF